MDFRDRRAGRSGQTRKAGGFYSLAKGKATGSSQVRAYVIDVYISFPPTLSASPWASLAVSMRIASCTG